ncbi:hypothetical protein SK128_003839 [Halocaridina rubra]|uniref:BED-type domain-containing protein n=1 Tax=Halocaridina rubra TaxID=373956 RepID=A0AAN8XNK8_HALRR
MNNGVHAGPQLSAETMGNSVPREGVSISLNDIPASGISGPMEISGVAGPTVGSTRRTSRVWRYFGMVDNCHYICRLCYFVGAYTNTTNMRKHIQHHHPERFQDILDHTRPTTRPFYSNTLIGMRPHLQQFPPQAHQQPQPQQQHPTFPTAANAMVYPHSIIAGKRAVPQPYSSSEQRQHPVVTTHQHSPLRIHHAPATTSSLQSCLIPHHTSSVSIPSSISFETASSYSCSVAQSVITTARASTPRPNIPSVAACELNQDESEIVTQILPPLATAAESSNDSEGCVKGLAGGDERGSSEYSQNDEETPAVASPEQFMAEGSEREPTPTPVASSPPKPESYQLRHNNHLTIVLEALARDEAFMDVTLTAQGRSLKAHKLQNNSETYRLHNEGTLMAECFRVLDSGVDRPVFEPTVGR